jgi:hypothetical protein
MKVLSHERPRHSVVECRFVSLYEAHLCESMAVCKTVWLERRSTGILCSEKEHSGGNALLLKAGDPANEICVRVRGGLGSARDT